MIVLYTNIKGQDCTLVPSLSVTDLVPGSQVGRSVI
jgi:hypothetical protein